MKTKISAFILAFLICLTFMFNFTSCSMVCGNKENTDHISKNVTNHGNQRISEVQKIMSCLYSNLKTKDGKILLVFGESDTLTVKNFNILILEDQLSLSSEHYSFVIDDSILNVLRQDDAYGGIGYGREWSVTLEVTLEDLYTGETSGPCELAMILYKSYEADARFRRDISIELLESNKSEQ